MAVRIGQENMVGIVEGDWDRGRGGGRNREKLNGWNSWKWGEKKGSLGEG